MTIALADPARAAYDELAFAYDALTADYCHERWLAELEQLARDYGLAGRRMLDVACGTGKSFLPLLRRGYAVTACDISPAMARRAKAKAPNARIFVADMRDLRRVGAFDLVTCLDDALNYLLSEADLQATLAGLHANLAPEGLALWDVNTLQMYRTAFASDWIDERDGLFIAWKGRGPAELSDGEISEATVDVFAPRADGWSRSRSFHRQRHWSVAEMRRAAESAGLHILAVRGQRRGAVIDGEVNEHLHTKVVFVATRDDARPSIRAGGDDMKIGGP